VKVWQKEIKVWHWIQICLLKILPKCNKWDRIDHQDFKEAHLQVIHNIEVHLQDKDNLEEDHLQAAQDKVSITYFYLVLFHSKMILIYLLIGRPGIPPQGVPGGPLGGPSQGGNPGGP
jgi:hypothetical protein